MASADALLMAQPPSRDPSAPDPSAAPPSRMDALTDLFDFSDNEDLNTSNNNATAQRNNTTSESRNPLSRNDAPAGLGLGIDEEIKIRKPRKQLAKLDTERLLSQKGIPKLRRITKERLKFKGKGHEFSDVAQLLTTYQLWLDDLFPKANFLDGLSMVEKLGHTNHIRVMRRAWVDEERRKDQPAEVSDADADEHFVENDGQDENTDALWVEAGAANTSNGSQALSGNLADEDIYGAPVDSGRIEGQDSTPRDQAMEDVPDDDELDALMAEDAAKEVEPSRPPTSSPAPDVDDFADDEEAMAGMW